ncbi:putative ribonuclease H-like domain-containing protein [Tanacetum coccineum]
MHHVMAMKHWPVQKQTAFGKDKSNPLIVDSLLKTIGLSIYLVVYNKELTIPEQTTTGKGISNPFLAAIPDEYLLKFHNVPDAKSLWEAIKSRFGGNEESKKMQKNVLKHQFENFTTTPNESLDKAYNRFQRLISQLEVYGAVVTKEDINEKFLRSLPPAWSQIALIMRNKADIDKVDTYDLYNNLKVYEDEMNKSSSSSSTSQNLAFLSSENTSSTNKVSTASREFGVNSAGGTSQVSTALCVHEIDGDDLEEQDLRWQVAMLTVRVKKFIKRTGRNMNFKEKRPVSLDKSKVECYNCHRKGHFPRECRSGRNQGRRSYGDNDRSTAPTKESSSQALVAQDGLGGYDWSNVFEIEPVNYALMAFSSSNSSGSSDKEVKNCSKQCVESFKSLQKNYDSDKEKYNRARLEIQGHEIALESLKARILSHEKNELAWGEKYEFQNYELKCREIKLDNLKLELEKVIKERDDLELKTTKWEASSKHLNELLNSQMSTRDKTGLGYGTQINELSSDSETDSEISLSVFDVRSSDEETTNNMSSKVDGFHDVPPPITGNFLTLRADISFAGLHEFAIRRKVIESQTTEINTNTSKTKTSENLGNEKKVNAEKPKSINESVVSKLNVNKEKVIIEDWTSDDEDEVSDVQTVCHVKGTNYNSVVSTGRPKVNPAKPVSTVRQSVSPARLNVCTASTARPFVLKIAHTGSAIRPIYPRIDNGNPEILLQDHAVVDSGCTSHMTGNKAYLSDYEDYNGGFVAFRSDPKGGKITGKGKIKTANLDFDDVYFVDELKFNLFSVSQMCDKKNSVLFTESECLILSPSFKLLDESQVVLRAPRKDDVYSLDLKNIVPSGGKQHKASCKAKLERTIRKPLELLHMDLFGPISVDIINKKRYCLVVTDDFSRFSWVFFLATKDETSEILCNFIMGLENQLNHTVKIIRSDNGTEFKNHIMNEFYVKKGIKREFSVARTPQQNGMAERKNRTLIEAARTMKSDEGYLLGYSTTSKAFRVYNKRTKRVEENLHIDFLEDKPNVAGTGPDWMFDLDFLTNTMNYIPVSVENQVVVDTCTQESYVAGSSGKDKRSPQEYILIPDSEDGADKEEQHQMSEVELVLQDELKKMVAQEVAAKAVNDAIRQTFDREKRKNASSKKADQATNTNSLSTDRPTVGTANKVSTTNATFYSDSNVLGLEDDFDVSPIEGIFSGVYDDNNVGAEADFNNMDNTIDVSPIPALRIHQVHPKDQILGDPKSAVQTRGKIKKASSAQQALVEAMQEELLQFKIQKVWVLVDLPNRKKVIGSKWVFRNKRDERSIVVKNKARLVTEGFRQEEGMDYDEVFAHVARIEAIGLFLAFTSYMEFTVYQIDVKSAFLYGTIEEEVYVHQPLGFVDPAHPNKVYKVVKALYGLHQAPRAWYETLSTFLLDNGFRRGTIDNTLFIKRNKRDIMLVQVYVDDIIFGSTKQSMCTEFEECMHKRFQMSSMGELTFFLGLQVKQQSAEIFISQDKYVANILKKFDFWSIRTANTPVESNKPLVKDEDGEDVDVHVYRSINGSLMYLTASRPNIMFAVYACARFQVTPKASHLQAVKRIFRYLKHQPKLGLWYPKDSPFDLEAYSDSDYGGASLDRKSTTEYVAASTISVIKNPVAHSRTKHIEIRFHFIRDCYEKRLIEVVKIHTNNNVADLLTKGFDVTRFNFLIVSIGMINV